MDKAVLYRWKCMMNIDTLCRHLKVSPLLKIRFPIRFRRERIDPDQKLFTFVVYKTSV